MTISSHYTDTTTGTRGKMRFVSVIKSLMMLVFVWISMLFITPESAQAQGFGNNCPSGWSIYSNGPGPMTCRENGTSSPTLPVNHPTIQALLAADAAAAAAEDNPGATALGMFYYSMGRNANGAPIGGGVDTCLSCDFITYFLIAMSQFSATLFSFFATFFYALGPMLIAMWIAVRVIQLNFNGGAGGGTFFMDLIKKLTILFFTWLIFTGAIGIMGPVPPGEEETSYYAGPTWVAAGPKLLEYSFMLNNDVRSQTAAGLMSVGVGMPDSSPFECGNLDQRVIAMVDDPAIDPAVVEITQTACVVERMHILGLATSVALITSAWNQLELSGNALLASVFKVIWGIILIAVFSLSMIWLVFVLLDVVVKALIVAGFLPIFGLTFLFKPTREVSRNALMQLIGVPCVAFALGLTSLLGFYLITATPTVYNNTYELMSPVFQRDLLPITETDTVERFATFISRIQMDSSVEEAIPAYISSPWLVYLLLVGLGIFSLGKKIISIIEEIMGIQGTTELADNAKKLATQGAQLGMGTAAAGAKVAQAAIPAAGIAAGAGAGGVMAGGGALASRMSGGAYGNSVQKAGGWLAGKAGSSALNRYTPFGRDGRLRGLINGGKGGE